MEDRPSGLILEEFVTFLEYLILKHSIGKHFYYSNYTLSPSSLSFVGTSSTAKTWQYSQTCSLYPNCREEAFFGGGGVIECCMWIFLEDLVPPVWGVNRKFPSGSIYWYFMNYSHPPTSLHLILSQQQRKQRKTTQKCLRMQVAWALSH